MHQSRQFAISLLTFFVAILWVPLLIASLFLVNNVIGWYSVQILMVLGILLPTLASLYCQCKSSPRWCNSLNVNETASIDAETFWSKYGNQTTQLLLGFAFMAFCISYNTGKQFSYILFIAGIIACFAIIVLNLFNSLVLLFRQKTYINGTPHLEGRQPAPLWCWSALLYSIDALALTGYLVFAVWQLSRL